MNTKVMTSSETTEWTTPRDLFDHLDKIYHFTLDAAATSENALCDKFYDEVTNGLAYSWKDEVVFVNPPYGRRHNRKWAQKISYEGGNTTVVALVAARTGSKWFQDYIAKDANILYFLKGRLKFTNAVSGAPFDSCIAVFYPDLKCDNQVIRFCKWEEI